MKTFDEHFETSCKTRDEYWKQYGTVDTHVLTHLVNPALMGGPAWPALRQAFIMAHGKNATIIASDGLSDPFDDVDPVEVNGFEAEFYVETEGKFNGIEECRSSWEFQLVYQMSQFAAHHGGIVSLLRELKYLSTELYDVPVPSEFLNESGRVGLLLGLPHSELASSLKLSASVAEIVNVRLLTQRELNFCVERGEEGRAELAKMMLAAGRATMSSLRRPSLV